MPKILSAMQSLPVFPALFRARRRNGDMAPEELTEIAFRYPLIRPLQVREEMTQFLRLVAELKPRRTLEIGSCRGGTLFPICRLSAPEATIISVDMPPAPNGGGYGYRWFQVPAFRMFVSPSQKLHLIRGDSHSQKTLERVAQILDGQQLDLLFIDGDHSYSGVKCDFEMYSPLVRRGGIIAFHDIVEHAPEVDCGVSRLWDEVKQCHEHLEIVSDWRQQWAGIGILFSEAPVRQEMSFLCNG